MKTFMLSGRITTTAVRHLHPDGAELSILRAGRAAQIVQQRAERQRETFMDTQPPRAPLGLRPQVRGSGLAASAVPGIALQSRGQDSGQGRGMTVPLTWAGSPWSLTGLSFLNFFLTIVTLGIYGFWGRTEVRKRIWSSVRLAGEPLEYTGTGKELFLGFLFVMGAVFVPLVLVSAGSNFVANKAVSGGIQIAIFTLFIYLGAVAMYRARRYRLSRTNWRGIRGSLVGNSWAYGWTSFWTLMLLPVIVLAIAGIARLAMGPSIVGRMAGMMAGPAWLPGAAAVLVLIAWLWLVPWRATKLYRHITDDMTFGAQPFSFVGSAKPLYARFVARWVGVVILAIATVAALYAVGVLTKISEIYLASRTNIEPKPQLSGREITWLIGILLMASFLYSIITAWYRAAQANILTAATRFEGVPLKLGVAAGGLIWLFVTNYLITSLSIGILKPVAEARTAKYFVERFAFDGPIDLERIAQSQAALGKTGEGLAQAFDVDAF
jgi:uncharacterized membrane protein YjgN (DUF898 family)